MFKNLYNNFIEFFASLFKTYYVYYCPELDKLLVCDTLYLLEPDAEIIFLGEL